MRLWEINERRAFHAVKMLSYTGSKKASHGPYHSGKIQRPFRNAGVETNVKFPAPGNVIAAGRLRSEFYHSQIS